MDSYSAGDFLKRYIKDYADANIQKSRGKYYCCPFCGSGTHEHETGALTIYQDSNTFTCHACGKTGNIYTLIGKIEGIDEYRDQLKRAAELYNIDIEWRKKKVTGQQEQKENFMDFYREANSHLGETDYWSRRGISKKLADRYMLGYVKNWKHPNTINDSRIPPSPRLIIPVSSTRYLARDIRKDEDIPEQSRDYKKQRVKCDDTYRFFNDNVLKNPKMPIFIAEGELDALSVIEVGGAAVGLGSTSMVSHFLELLDSWKVDKKTVFIVSLDNETNSNTRERELELCTGLKERGYPFYRINPCGESKDANEALCRGREEFAETVRQIEADPAFYVGRMEYMQNCTGAHLQEFLQGIGDSANTPCTPTGFKELDKLLDGGLYPGLYTLGAVTSAGKSTFVLQIMDQIAAQERDVLYFSLEMSRSELIAKSVSRNTLLIAEDAGLDTSMAKTTRGILAGHLRKGYSKEEKDLIDAAVAEYAKHSERTFISEGVGDIGVKQIRKTVEDHIKYTGRTPVCIVDYLQILAPEDIRMTDKQAVDKSVLELKRLSRDMNAPVIAISSFNRESYKGSNTNASNGVSLAAYKESGSLEYGSDVLIALNPSDEKSGEQFVSNIELFILKNRNGTKTWNYVNEEHDPVCYRYYMLHNLFVEQGRKSDRTAGAAGRSSGSGRRGRPKKTDRGGFTSNVPETPFD